MSQAPSMTMPSLFSPSERPEDSLVKYHEEAIRRYLTDVSLANNNASQQASNQADGNQINQGAGGGSPLKGLNAAAGAGLAGLRREGERPLDLSRNLELARSLGMNFPTTNNTNNSDINFQLNDPKNDSLAAKSAADKLSEKIYGLDGLLSDDEYYHIDVPEGDDNDFGNNNESNPTSPASTTGSNKQFNSAQSKRFRTHMNSTQIKLMKSVFIDYKTPTMTECEMLGREIQLQKRVIQVWFQNARAKEKKAKLALMKIIGHEPEGRKAPSECKVCNFEYNSKYSIQDHMFTRAHIDNMRAFIEKQKAENDQHLVANNAEENSNFNPLAGQFGTNQFHPNNIQLHMAQLMALNNQSTDNLNERVNPNGNLNGDVTNLNNSVESNSSGENTTENNQINKNNHTAAMNRDNDSGEHQQNPADDMSRLQLLHQVYQQMGINGPMPNTNNGSGQQHSLLQQQQPMIEG